MGEIEIRRVPDDEADGDEVWERSLSDDDDALGLVDATRDDDLDDWNWSVGFAAMEFVRDDPLETTVVAAIESTIRAVPGVVAVAREDREVWIVRGRPSGEALVAAAGTVIDGFAESIRATITDE